MHIAFRLEDDAERIRRMQDITGNPNLGYDPTHGEFFSPEWWANIRSGSLPTHTVQGSIERVYMTGHNDYPEFELRTETGEVLPMTRESNSEAQDRLYQVGRHIEIDYVLQQHRPDGQYPITLPAKVVLEVRISDD